MYSIEKPRRFICGIFLNRSAANAQFAELRSGYRLRVIPLKKYPVYLLESILPAGRRFRYYATMPEAKANISGSCILYTFMADWKPTVAGEDQMGAITHEHFEIKQRRRTLARKKSR